MENRDQIQNIEFRLHIKNREPFELIAESAPIIIQRAIDVSKISKLDIQGEILVDRDDVKIVLREKIAHGAVEESGGFFQPVALFIENNSDHEVKVYIYEGILNGTTFEDIFHVILPSGKKCFQSINFYLDEIENAKIERSENLEFKFSMYEGDMRPHLFDSDNIVIDFND